MPIEFGGFHFETDFCIQKSCINIKKKCCKVKDFVVTYLSRKDNCIRCTYNDLKEEDFTIAGYLQGGIRMSGDQYFIVKKKAVPEVLLKVVEAKRLLDSERALTVQEAADAVDISRSSFYKYRDDIFPFHENTRGKTITFMLQMDDKPGLLSSVLNQVANDNANILTIHQSIPINGIALLTLSVEILPQTSSTSTMMDSIEAIEGVHSINIVARE